MNSKKFKLIGDIITIVLLTVAFAMAFWFGFFPGEGDAPSLPGGTLAGFIVLGMGVLFFVGEVSAYSSRKRLNALTPLFVGGFCAQIAAYIGIVVIGFCAMYPIFEGGVQSWLLRILYIVFALVMICGYTEAVFVSEPLIARLSPAEEEDEEDEEDEEE